jgi:hypothetical protein
LAPLPDEEKPSKVPLVVLNSRGEDLSLIHSHRLSSGDGGGIGSAILEDMFYAAGSVVKRYGLNPAVVEKELAALVQSHRVRENPAQVSHPNPSSRDQIMCNSQAQFPLDEYFARQQEVKVLGHRPGQ